MKKVSYLIIALLASALVACGGCKGPTPTPEPEPEPTEKPDLSLIKQTVPVNDDWVWSGKPQITVSIENPNKASVKLETIVKISTDSKKEVTTIKDSVTVAGNSTQDFVFSTTDNLEPGVYRASCFVNGKAARHFYFAIDPFQIVSAPDKQPDFEQFWQAAKDQLAAVEMNAKLTDRKSVV